MMNKLENVARVAWRGAVAAEERPIPAEAVVESGRGRVLLLVGPGGNRDRLVEHLGGFHNVVQAEASQLPAAPFDLVIVDVAGFRDWRQHLIDAKLRDEPTFLPVILIASRRDLRQRLKSFWDTIDEFILTPIDRGEFIDRVDMLLRARRLALAQRAHLAYVVNYDRISGLPNKNLFMDRLVTAIQDASVLNKQVHVTVVTIPLARILKSLGHQGFERAAATCSSRLRALLGADVSLAQLGSEEWGLIHRVGTPMDAVLEACSRIRRLADAPVEIGGERIRISPRMGIGVYPEDGSDAAAVLDCALSALSNANETGPAFYSRTDQDKALRFIRTEARLHEALEREQFELWFQPQIRLADRRTAAVEALVRWRLPSGELVPPMSFMEVAQATGLICPIDRWVLEKACATMQQWREQGVGVERVAVNVAAEDIVAADFAGMIESALERYNLPPSSLEIELTETALFEISGDCLDKLNRLRRQGISIAVDDFGTGYSSLSYLHRLPITVLKIDKAFVRDVDRSRTNAAITRTIVWLAKNFELETVAEGVETEAEAEFLASLDVRVGQGFLYAHPMPEMELRRWLAQQGG